MSFRINFFGLLLAVGLAGQTVPVETYPMVGDLSMPLVMQQGADGTVWVGSSSGLYRVAGGKLIPARGGRTASSVFGIEEFGGSLWLGTLSGIFRWTDGKMDLIHPGAPFGLVRQGKHLYFVLAGQAGLHRMDLEECVGHAGCQSVLIDARATWRPARGADGRLWFPCGKQICAFDEKLGSGGSELRGLERGVPELEWQKCLVDRRGALWALASTGVYRQLPGEALLRLLPGMVREGTQSDNLGLDSEGDIVASSLDLIWLGGRQKFFSSEALGRGVDVIQVQFVDRSGGTWFGFTSGQIVRLKSKGMVEVWGERDGFGPIVLNHMVLDDGSEWCRSRNKVLYLRPGAKAWESIAIPGRKGQVRLHKAGQSRLVAELPVDNRLFEIDTNSSKLQSRKVEEIHTEGPTLVLPSGEDLVWIRKTGPKEERIRIPMPGGTRGYRSFVEDREGRLWFVTANGLLGVNRDGTQRLFTNRDGLRMNELQVAELGVANDLWIGYDAPSDVTVMKLPIGVLGKKTLLELKHLAPSREKESVVSFGFDLKNRIWKGTNSGMLISDAIRPESANWLVMNEADGLPHPDIVMNSFLRFPDGSVGFNTVMGRARVYEPEKLFQPGQGVSVNGVLEDGNVKLAMMPAEAASHVKLEYRKRSWFEGWKTVPGLEFAVGRDVEGIEVRVVDNYFYRGNGSLKLGEERVPQAAWWLLGGFVALLGWWFRVFDNLWFRWQKKYFVAPLELPHAVVEDLLPGTLLKDRFQIGKVLARGSFSDVYEALDVANEDSRVVVKRLKLPDFGGDFSESWLKRRFMQEVGAATMLRHPGVLPIIEAWIELRSPDAATPYLVMRRVEGPTLRSYLNEHGRLKPDRALGWLKQLGEVMEEAHSRGIIHCDLKPENIMLEPQGESFRLLVIDFGTSALCLESEVMSKQTRPVGTATYMAPEQLMGSYSAASDLYAFALISLEMLSGAQYRELEIRFDDNWEKDLQIALGKLGLTINTAQVFVRGLRFVPQQRDQSLAKWALSLEASLLEQ